MNVSQDHCRAMRPDEAAPVAELLTRTFGGDAEARLVDLLRCDGGMARETVLTSGTALIGYCALSRFRAPPSWLCLAPVAVDPDHQRRGHGLRMLRQVTDRAPAAGETIVVLGQTGFYEQAGFSRARAAKLTTPYPLDHTLLAGPGADAPSETLVYPAAFEAL